MVEPYPGATEEILAEGYAVQDQTADTEFPNDYYWVCPTCVKDFAELFEWTVIEEPIGSRRFGSEPEPSKGR
jgi:hypothetical protein